MRFAQMGCAVVLVSALIVSSGCSARAVRALARASKDSDKQKSQQESAGYTITPLKDDNRPIFNEDREWTPRIYKRYAEQMGDVKDIKCIDRAIAAWQSDTGWDKPTPERMTVTFSTLFNDLKGKKMGLRWAGFTSTDGSTYCLTTNDQQTVVFIDAIMYDWVTNKRRNYSTDKLVQEITDGMNSNGKTAALIGLDQH